MTKALVDKNTGVIYDVERPWLGGNIVGGDARCMDNGVFDYLIERFDPKNLVDVGCGEGQLMSYFYDRGIDVVGIDGLEDNRENAVENIRDKIIVHDYIKGVPPTIATDMVISCEFVEHVHKRFMVNYLPQFVYGNTLVFTHAQENQPGYYHVNCKNDQYWINLITSLGMVYLEEETTEARSRVKESFWETILIFKKKFT